MRVFERILVPVHRSASSEKALRLASLLSEQSDAELNVLYVDHTAPETISELYPEHDEFRARPTDPHEMLTELVSRLPRRAASRAYLRVAYGEPEIEILRLARSSRADLIVMGSRTRTGLSRLIGGSLGERLTRKARCPVLVVPWEPPPGESGEGEGSAL